jgi:glycosyltransferase involved in cell wall biosynthesis
MSRPLISILSPTLAGNALGRVHVLAELLQADFDIEVVAFAKDARIWQPLQSSFSFPCRRFFFPTMGRLIAGGHKMIRNTIRGDLLLAVKPLMPSFGVGLWARRLLRRPLILDIDDDEIGFLSDSLYWEFRRYKTQWFTGIDSPLYTRICGRFVRRPDALLVSNSVLQKRYGGVWIPHARDDRVAFDAPHQCVAEKPAEDGTPHVLFLGSARSHKGLDDLVAAWKLIRHPSAILTIAGTPSDHALIRPLRDAGVPRVVYEGPVALQQLYQKLRRAAVVVIPQKDGAASQRQLPMKLIDAMAAGCPIVATSVGDIPRWLDEGAGLVVPPSSPSQLANAIDALLDDTERARAMGRSAYQRFCRFGSFSAVRPRLVNLVHGLLNKTAVLGPAEAFAEGNDRSLCMDTVLDPTN